MARKKTDSQERLEALKADGGCVLNIHLNAHGHDDLDSIQSATLESKTTIIHRLLRQAASRLSRRGGDR